MIVAALRLLANYISFCMIQPLASSQRVKRNCQVGHIAAQNKTTTECDTIIILPRPPSSYSLIRRNLATFLKI